MDNAAINEVLASHQEPAIVTAVWINTPKGKWIKYLDEDVWTFYEKIESK